MSAQEGTPATQQRTKGDIIRLAIHCISAQLAQLKTGLDDLFNDHALWKECTKKEIVDFIDIYLDRTYQILISNYATDEQYQEVIELTKQDDLQQGMDRLFRLQQVEVFPHSLKKYVISAKAFWDVLDDPVMDFGSDDSTEVDENRDPNEQTDESMDPNEQTDESMNPNGRQNGGH